VPPGAMGEIWELALGAGYVKFFDKSFIFDEHDGKRPIEIGDLRFEPDETQHYVRTWGFRVQARGAGEDPNKIFAFSADAGPCPALPRLADHADLFLCEAALRSLKEDDPAPQSRGHLMPAEAAEVAQGAGARRPARQPEDTRARGTGQRGVQAGSAEQRCKPQARAAQQVDEEPDSQQRGTGPDPDEPDQQERGGAGGETLHEVALLVRHQLGRAVGRRLRGWIGSIPVVRSDAHAGTFSGTSASGSATSRAIARRTS